jgi:putative transposase
MAGMNLIEVGPRKRSVAEWRALVRAYAQRSGTAPEFCREHGVAVSTLDWWRRRLQKEPGSVGPGRRRRAATTQPVSFIELPAVSSAARTQWDIELELGEGMVLRLRRGSC